VFALRYPQRNKGEAYTRDKLRDRNRKSGEYTYNFPIKHMIHHCVANLERKYNEKGLKKQTTLSFCFVPPKLERLSYRKIHCAIE
jgi:hypothetical protein